jgi:guanosine-3',5'-bis(diphosphate) 3'-pyrophosphohydrolase
MLHKAILLARAAHDGQKDKGGRPYVLHCLRVMARLETEEEMTVGVLHDVLEDTFVTPRFLLDAGFPAQVIEAVVALTRAPGERYMEYIHRVGRHALATKVKMADLADNLDPDRAGPWQDALRIRYEIAQTYLGAPEIFDKLTPL